MYEIMHGKVVCDPRTNEVIVACIIGCYNFGEVSFQLIV